MDTVSQSVAFACLVILSYTAHVLFHQTAVPRRSLDFFFRFSFFFLCIYNTNYNIQKKNTQKKNKKKRETNKRVIKGMEVKRNRERERTNRI